MDFWPADYEESWTLAKPFSRKGVGLHSGEDSEVCIKPSDFEGFHVRLVNHQDSPVTLNLSQIRYSPLCTTFELGKHRLSTVEHLLAAFAGCGLTHVQIEVTGDEIPLLDGSSKCWVEAIKDAGIVRAKTPRKPSPTIREPIFINRGQSLINAVPSQRFKLVGIIDFSYEAIGRQIFSIELSPDNFIREIAPARTFGFVDQVDELKKAGLIKGGALENALVCNGKSWVNPPLRFKDEPVRHKLLDLIGDLALVGLPKAQVLVYRGSHALHADFAEAILKSCSSE